MNMNTFVSHTSTYARATLHVERSLYNQTMTRAVSGPNVAALSFSVRPSRLATVVAVQ